MIEGCADTTVKTTGKAGLVGSWEDCEYPATDPALLIVPGRTIDSLTMTDSENSGPRS